MIEQEVDWYIFENKKLSNCESVYFWRGVCIVVAKFKIEKVKLKLNWYHTWQEHLSGK